MNEKCDLLITTSRINPYLLSNRGVVIAKGAYTSIRQVGENSRLGQIKLTTSGALIKNRNVCNLSDYQNVDHSTIFKVNWESIFIYKGQADHI